MFSVERVWIVEWWQQLQVEATTHGENVNTIAARQSGLGCDSVKECYNDTIVPHFSEPNNILFPIYFGSISYFFRYFLFLQMYFNLSVSYAKVRIKDGEKRTNK